MTRRGYYPGKMADLRAEWGGRCVWCGLPSLPSNPLEFVHLPGKHTTIEGRGRGLPQRYHDIKRNPGSYVLLCRDHHTALDKRGGGLERGRIVRRKTVDLPMEEVA